jgi:formate dehydrogenase iron-sulfur subunit
VSITEVTPVDLYLAEQASLTAVERFARQHSNGELADVGQYRDLVPLRDPAPGEQYGFEVDLDACTGCKACVTACNNLNGLDDGESWRSVGFLHGSNGQPHRETVTTTCHHCVDPACLNGCPANAYTKDPSTGIVKHLDDQCIGCGYCALTCPYEVPQYNARLGIVRKCDMCSDRLASGEAPACVQGCPNGAIRIALVDVDALVASSKTATLLPDAPPSSSTVPTTTYRSSDPRKDLIAADHFALRPAHAHPPLALMLVLTQLSVGAFGVDLVLRLIPSLAGESTLEAMRPVGAVVALALGLLALGASVFHLGRPLYAFRAALGIRRSWLSREIVAFGGFAGLATLHAGVLLVAPRNGSGLLLPALVAASGLTGVLCSVMVYVVTGRTWWRARAVLPKFFLTTIVCGLATILFVSFATGATTVLVRQISIALVCAVAIKLGSEAVLFRHLLSRTTSDLKRTAKLLTGDLGRLTWSRFGAGVFGGLVLPTILSNAQVPTVLGSLLAGFGLLAVVAGELIERSQFFRAMVSARMPGDLA